MPNPKPQGELDSVSFSPPTHVFGVFEYFGGGCGFGPLEQLFVDSQDALDCAEQKTAMERAVSSGRLYRMVMIELTPKLKKVN